MGTTQEVPPVTGVDTPDFGDWVGARGAALQRFAYLVTGSASDAPDLVQEALSRAYPRWAELARSDTLEAYVRRSIVNASISGWRKNRRLVVVDDPEARPARVTTTTTRPAPTPMPTTRGGSVPSCRRGSGPPSCCASTRTSPSPRSPWSSTAPSRPPGPTSTAPSQLCARD
ncbi:MAG: putative polymerase sigma factor [Nocardioides sp.]|nr:putative polymerase sigma factor [Nocardioides sp.]